MADNKEALPVVAYLRATKDRVPVWDEDCVCQDPVYPADPDGSDAECISLPLCDADSATAALSELRAEVGRLNADLDWLRDNLFTHKWNGVIGKGCAVQWQVAPDYRFKQRELSDASGIMAGDFRRAIDTARSAASGESAEGGNV